jgi:dTDP-4-dehydrorhamnose 3,5-epimerase
MQIELLEIDGAFVTTPTVHGDDRGHFAETFRADVFAQTTGHPFTLAQANTSLSVRGVARGVHFALVPPGQAKYVACLAGTIVDYVIDVRVGSPTFGTYTTVELDSTTRRAVYLSEGLGHAFCVLSESATVSYYCSTPYSPTHEFGVNPLDPDLALAWPSGLELLFSPKDSAAPTLAQARERGELPDYEQCRTYIEGLRTASTPSDG